MEWDVSLGLVHRFHILIDMQFDLNILHPSKATEKTLLTMTNTLLTMFTLAPESPRNLHVTPLTSNDTNGTLVLVGELNRNMYSWSGLDGGEHGFDFLFTWLMVWGGLEVQPLCFLFPFWCVLPLPQDWAFWSQQGFRCDGPISQF